MSLQRRREELTNAFRKSRAELETALEGLTEEEMLEPSIDGWSVKDHLAHISQWDEMRSVEISRISAGYPAAVPPMDDEQVDEFNNLHARLRRGWSLERVRGELEFTRSRVLEAIARSTEAGLDQSRYQEVGLEGGAGHESEHAAVIRRWKEKRRAAAQEVRA